MRDQYRFRASAAKKRRAEDCRGVSELPQDLSSLILLEDEVTPLNRVQTARASGVYENMFRIDDESAVFDVAKEFWRGNTRAIYYRDIQVNVQDLKRIESPVRLRDHRYKIQKEIVSDTPNKDWESLSTIMPDFFSEFFKDIPVVEYSEDIQYVRRGPHEAPRSVVMFLVSVRPGYAEALNEILANFDSNFANFLKQYDNVPLSFSSRASIISLPPPPTAFGQIKALTGNDPSLALMMYAVRYRTRDTDTTMWSVDDPELNALIQPQGQPENVTTYLFRTKNINSAEQFGTFAKKTFTSEGYTYFLVDNPSEELKRKVGFLSNDRIADLESTQLGWKYAVPPGAFMESTTLWHLSVPKGMTHIDEIAFQNSALRSITLPNSLRSIGTAAFRNCTLRGLDLPSNLRNIGDRAFERTTLPSELRLPEFIEKVGDHAFKNVSELEAVSFFNEDYHNATTVTTIGKKAFYSCSNLTTVTLPFIKVIRKETFRTCTALQTVYLVEHLETIEARAFQNCTSLTTINFPESLQHIGEGAFQECGALTHVHFLQNLKTIAERAFQGCEKLERLVTNNPQTIADIGKDAFRRTSLKYFDENLENRFPNAFNKRDYRLVNEPPTWPTTLY